MIGELIIIGIVCFFGGLIFWAITTPYRLVNYCKFPIEKHIWKYDTDVTRTCIKCESHQGLSFHPTYGGWHYCNCEQYANRIESEKRDHKKHEETRKNCQGKHTDTHYDSVLAGTSKTGYR